MPNPAEVNRLFSRIAHRYDLANHLLSGGADLWWRRRLVAGVRAEPARDVLDLATGSGDVAFALARGLPVGTRIIGMDFCQPMLDEAEKKLAVARGLRGSVRFRAGDGLALPEADASFDAVTIAFGLRNMADRARALGEMSRVLRPGGRLFVLEFSQPEASFKPLYYAYLRHLLPRIARWVTGNDEAYEYLGGSIAEFPDHLAVADEIRRAGFSRVEVKRMTLGIVALHTAWR
jgi:demethylmenaquinone methyltransferase/2-methoxy-6-polyprenyl-1,4-benzoquinol methylase